MNSLDVFTMYSPKAGSARVRIYDWLRHLNIAATEHQYIRQATAGPKTLLREPLAVANAERLLRKFDARDKTVLVSREISPLSRGHAEQRILRKSEHGIYDFDDALFNDSSMRRRLFGGGRKFELAVSAADTVIAGSSYLAEWAKDFNRNVVIVPSCIEPSAYLHARPRNQENPTLVWLGSASTEQFLIPLIGDLLELNRLRGTRLKLISSAADNPSLDRLKPIMSRVQWRADTFARELADADVALAPLVDTPYARGKCAYKILQYAATGIPTVGSPIGENRAALARLHGLAVNAGESWVDAIMQILDESEKEAAMRTRAATAAVRRYYAFSSWAATWMRTVFPRDTDGE